MSEQKQSIDQLVINNPYEEPKEYWKYDRESQKFERMAGRRKAGYLRASQGRGRRFDDPGEFVEIELINKIRPRVKAWRDSGYPNVTGITKELLKYWHDPSNRSYQPFWCQFEAVETAIWLTEASEAEKQGVDMPKDAELVRECFKLATGAGKTVVMAMLICWQALNKIANPTDKRFSKYILIIAPGITVRDRLQVLLPDNEENFYQQFGLLDAAMWQNLLQAKIIVTNWHALAPEREDSGPKVVKKGPEGDDAFVRRVLPDFGGAQNILVINDEAHHCHRPEPSEEAQEKERATIWVDGIDKIRRARKVLRVYDLSATPFRPTGHGNQAEKLFPWIVSDFGLNDAIEAGLVKTPRVAVRDDSKMTDEMRSKLFHIYVEDEVKNDLNRRAEPNEGLPDLVRNAVSILGADWLTTKHLWQEANQETPPVLIMIANRIETAARLEHGLMSGQFAVDELGEPDQTLRIDQDALDKLDADENAELQDKTKQKAVENQRARFNTVGKLGKPGEQVQCVIGVNMLSEGWDTRTVTHILGLRAFTSQLLCEQVVGRGLRRVSYDLNEHGMFEPEYVTVFGIPFTFLPVEGDTKTKPPTGVKKTRVHPVPERKDYEIAWPHVLRVDYKMGYFLEVDWDKIDKLTISSDDAPTIVEIAPVIDGKPKLDALSEVDLNNLAEKNRLQTLKLRAAAELESRLGKNWEGDPGSHIGQLMEFFDQFISSDKLDVKVPKNYDHAEKLRNIMIALNAQKITNHISGAIRSGSKNAPTAILDPVRPKRSTGTAFEWWTGKATQPTVRSHMSHIVSDSSWELRMAQELDRDRISGLISWVKNDHIGFQIYYIWQGVIHPYFPDFILKFGNNHHVIIEVKGQTTDQDRAKWDAAHEWVAAVNALRTYGTWEFKVLSDPKDIFEVVE